MSKFDKYLFLTVCSNTKNPESFKTAMPLSEMYIGPVYCARVGLLKCITDEIYITSLLGPGIVRDTYVDYGYDAPPPPILKKYVKDPNFCIERRRMFEERYPGRLDKVEKVFFLGDSNYDECIRGIFPDKEVVICMKKKLPVGKLNSLLKKAYWNVNDIKELPKDKYKQRVYVYGNYLFEYITKQPTQDEWRRQYNSVYEFKDGKYHEIDVLSGDVDFINKFKEVTGNLPIREYCIKAGSTGKNDTLRYEVVCNYFEKVLGCERLNFVDKSDFVMCDYVNNSDILDSRFVDVLNEVKMNK